MELKKNYKYIEFKEIPNPGKKTRIFRCTNRLDDVLGDVRWYSHWRQYCFEPESSMLIFAKSCLDDISDFIEQLMNARKTSAPKIPKDK